MNSGEDFHAAELPFFLTINWVWLFLADCAEVSLRLHYKFHGWPSLDIYIIWSFLQAAWLMRVDQRSTAIFWYAADFLLYRVGLAPWMRTQHASVGRALVIAAAIFTWVSVLHFRREKKLYFLSTDELDLDLTIPMTLFFSTLYFQSWFRKVAEVQQADLRRITPSVT